MVSVIQREDYGFYQVEGDNRTVPFAKLMPTVFASPVFQLEKIETESLTHGMKTAIMYRRLARIQNPVVIYINGSGNQIIAAPFYLYLEQGRGMLLIYDQNSDTPVIFCDKTAKDPVLSVFPFTWTDQNGEIASRPATDYPFIYAKKSATAQKFYRQMGPIKHSFDHKLVKVALYAMVTAASEQKVKPSVMNHSKSISELIFHYVPSTILYYRGGIIRDPKYYWKQFGFRFRPYTFEDVKRQAPIISFNQKERDYISEYISRYVQYEDGSYPTLSNYFQYLRYGPYMQFQPDGCTEEKMIMAAVDGEILPGYLQLSFVEPLVTDWVILICQIKIDGDCGSLLRQIVSAIIFFHSENPNRNPKKAGIDQSYLYQEASRNRIIEEYIHDMIIIHDHPERSKVIRISEVIPDENTFPVEPNQVDIPDGRRTRKRQQQDRDHRLNTQLISRVLKPTAEAKQYMASIGSKWPRSDAKYMVAEWERCGHWRMSPSGHKIWIAPTTCHRRKPMVPKQFHVKL